MNFVEFKELVYQELENKNQVIADNSFNHKWGFEECMVHFENLYKYKEVNHTELHFEEFKNRKGRIERVRIKEEHLDSGKTKEYEWEFKEKANL